MLFTILFPSPFLSVLWASIVFWVLLLEYVGLVLCEVTVEVVVDFEFALEVEVWFDSEFVLELDFELTLELNFELVLELELVPDFEFALELELVFELLVLEVVLLFLLAAVDELDEYGQTPLVCKWAGYPPQW